MRRPPYGRNWSARTRAASTCLLAAGTAAAAGIIAWSVFGGFDVDKAALLVALLTLDASLAAFLWPAGGSLAPEDLADDLAGTVRLQWLDEVHSRKLREPGILPLTWSATGREGLSDTSGQTVPVGDEVRLRRLRLRGRLDGRFEEVVRQLADGYRQLPRGRLVLLGEPGAGKTVLAMLLTLGLLEARDRGTRAPVLLAVSSWDPLSESLDDWIVRSIATSYYNGQEETPRRLLRCGLLLPVLDGLDEMPESARRSAVHEINTAVGDDRPVVVTCRSAEYTDVIKGGAPALHEAPVVEIQPLEPADVIAYLRAVGWPPETDWTPIYAHLTAQSSGPGRVAAALSTPLMVSLARLGYERCGGEPAELLDSKRFPSRHSVEDHLIDRLVEAAYAPRHPGARAAPARFSAQQADRWLRFLAGYLHGHRDRDLAWWMLSQRLLSPWVAPGVGTLAGATLMAAMFMGWFFLSGGGPSYELLNMLTMATLAGAIYAMLAMVIWYAAAGRAPGRLVLSARGSVSRLRRGFRNGIAAAAIPGALTVAGFVVFGVVDGWELGDAYRCGQIIVMMSALMLVMGVALAVHSWLDAPPERSARADPLRYLQQDRASSLAGATAAGITLGVLFFPALVPSSTLGTLLGQAAGGSPATSLTWSQLGSLSAARVGFSWNSVGDPTAVCAAFVLPGVVFAGLVLLTRAWPRFVVARLILAAQGKLPFRLMGFLGEARDRGLLRQSGGVYQFRHIRFQERLATRPSPALLTPHSVTGPASRRMHRARRPMVVGAAVLVVLLLAQATPDDRMLDVSPPSDLRFTSVALNRTGTVVAASTRDGTIRVWRRDTWAIIARGALGKRVSALALSDDARSVAFAIGAVGYVYRTAALSGPPIAVFRHPPGVTPADIAAIASADHGNLWALGTSQGEVAVWSVAGRRLAASLRDERTFPISYGVGALTVGRGGNRIGVVTDESSNGMSYAPYVRRDDRFVTVAAPGSPGGSVELPASDEDFYSSVAVAVASDPLVVAAFSGTGIYLLHHPAAEPAHVIDVGYSDQEVDELALSANGRVLAATVSGSVCLWDMPAAAL